MKKAARMFVTNIFAFATEGKKCFFRYGSVSMPIGNVGTLGIRQIIKVKEASLM